MGAHAVYPPAVTMIGNWSPRARPGKAGLGQQIQISPTVANVIEEGNQEQGVSFVG